jgi:hypothetical protein
MSHVRKLIVALFLLSFTVEAQAAHTSVLTWTASTDTGSTYNIYRAAGTIGSGDVVTCPAAPTIPNTGTTWTEITTGVTSTTYTDTTVTVGSAECYVATSVLNGLEGQPSNIASDIIFPAPPTGLTAIGH